MTGCSTTDWAWAAVDVIPVVGKVASKGRKAYRAVRSLRRSCGCFAAGTLVATPDGLVAIETIGVGDLVLAQNEATGEIAAKPVADLVRPEPKALYELTLADARGEIETFHATDDHPWKVRARGWVETVELTEGDNIDTASSEDMVLLSVRLTDRIERTYNLTVSDWHTFMVGEDRAVVHNANCKTPPRGRRAPTQRCTTCGTPGAGWVTGRQCPDCYAKSRGLPFGQAIREAADDYD